MMVVSEPSCHSRNQRVAVMGLPVYRCTVRAVMTTLAMEPMAAAAGREQGERVRGRLGSGGGRKLAPDR